MAFTLPGFELDQFVRGTLAEEGIARVDPDGFLMDLWPAQAELLRAVAADTLAEARRLSGAPWEMRALMKKARLPRLGRALARD